jgi:hypothetical protein
MTTLPPGIPFSQDAPVNSVKRQSWLRSLQQRICELLIKMKKLEPRETEGRKV